MSPRWIWRRAWPPRGLARLQKNGDWGMLSTAELSACIRAVASAFPPQPSPGCSVLPGPLGTSNCLNGLWAKLSDCSKCVPFLLPTCHSESCLERDKLMTIKNFIPCYFLYLLMLHSLSSPEMLSLMFNKWSYYYLKLYKIFLPHHSNWGKD